MRSSARTAAGVSPPTWRKARAKLARDMKQACASSSTSQARPGCSSIRCRAGPRRRSASSASRPDSAAFSSSQARTSSANRAADSCAVTTAAPGRALSVSLRNIVIKACSPAKSGRPAVRTTITGGSARCSMRRALSSNTNWPHRMPVSGPSPVFAFQRSRSGPGASRTGVASAEGPACSRCAPPCGNTTTSPAPSASRSPSGTSTVALPSMIR